MTDQYPDPFRNDPPDEVRRVGPGGGAPPWYVGLIGGMILVILVIAVALLARGDDQSIDTATSTTQSTGPTLPSTSSSTATTASSTTTSTPSSTTTSAGSSTTATSTSSSGSSTQTTVASTTVPSTTAPPTTVSSTTTIDPTQYASAVWPDVETSTRYQDPVAAAGGFAEEFVGFDDPLLGEFLQGDSRSGEVQIRAAADGAVTTVFVRQLGPDNTWWVLGSASENIELLQPTALDEIQSPLTVAGEALAFEGVVSVELRADDSSTPLFEGTVTGGGATREPFEGQFAWTDQPDGSGALILYVENMDDGSIWEASVVRLMFAAD